MQVHVNSTALRELVQKLAKLEKSWKIKFPNALKTIVLFKFNGGDYELVWHSKIFLQKSESDPDFEEFANRLILTSSDFSEVDLTEPLLEELAHQIKELHARLVNDNSLKLPAELVEALDSLC